jgi:phospholipid/cholesterol/gamma-HCH transport system permease protein
MTQASGTFLDNIAGNSGRIVREFIEHLGAAGMFFFGTLVVVPGTLKKPHLIAEQMLRMGVYSLPIVFLTSAFIGLVSAWQYHYISSDIIPLTYMGAAMGKVIFTDLGPVLTALVLTGRIGARLAAELGTMKVTEQIDAMTCLSINPYTYLLTPRIAAGFLMTPILMIFSFFFSLVSAQLLSLVAFDVNTLSYYNSLRLLFKFHDVIIGIVKGFVFGGGIAFAGCYYGFFTVGGAVGVGESTKRAVVVSAVFILFSNVVINLMLM